MKRSSGISSVLLILIFFSTPHTHAHASLSLSYSPASIALLNAPRLAIDPDVQERLSRIHRIGYVLATRLLERGNYFQTFTMAVEYNHRDDYLTLRHVRFSPITNDVWDYCTGLYAFSVWRFDPFRLPDQWRSCPGGIDFAQDDSDAVDKLQALEEILRSMLRTIDYVPIF